MGESFNDALTRSHSHESMGPYTVVYFHSKACTYEATDGFTGRRVKHAMPASWAARVYVGEDQRTGWMVRLCTTKAKARKEIRKTMRARFDRIPAQLDRLEAEYERLREVFR